MREREQRRVPIIKLWSKLLVPLQGEINDDLADQLSREVLDAIARTGATGMIVDITGVSMLDSHLCSVLVRIAAAARLMGATTIISGMSADIAQTLQAMGLELQHLRSALSIEQAMALLGVVPEKQKAPDELKLPAPRLDRRRP